MSLHAKLPAEQRIAIRIRGRVQGVGFRPYVVRLARALQLTGLIRNDGEGVYIEAQGTSPEILSGKLLNDLPALARIDSIEIESLDRLDEDRPFTVMESVHSVNKTLLPVDTTVCEACLTELFDPDSRYYLYPFINCSHCGPRYTVVHRLPYDRQYTSLRDFPMCDPCNQEYHDMASRRFHAQPTACDDCGPALSDSIDNILQYIADGKIVALKGLGGYHLVCDASNPSAVERLRRRKQRDGKPFALMVANTLSARSLVDVDETAHKLLNSAQRPIVLLPRKETPDFSLAEKVAPGLQQLGIMLPYTPLHYLLFYHAAGQPEGIAWLQLPQTLTLVMTSANPHGEPLVTDNHEALRRLKNIADHIVSHNRDIITPLDDSVVEPVGEHFHFIRRARGYVPESIRLPYEVPVTLAVGAHLKNTFCITRGDEAFVSQHIGSLDNPATIHFFTDTVERLCDFLQVSPQIVAHDLHPDFVSSRFARDYAEKNSLKLQAVQHHHAHLAAAVAEYHIEQPVLGLVMDGYGMGDDGTAWGGELLLLSGAQYHRLGHLLPLAQPGGEQAAREPWRMAASVLYQLGKAEQITQRFAQQPLAGQVEQLLQQDLHCPMTSSAGRLFDAVSALLNITMVNQYEAEAAVRLQHQVTSVEILQDGWMIRDNVLDLSPLLLALLDKTSQSGANLFHGTLVAALSDWVMQQARQQGISTILLSGGCFLNRILLQGVRNNLQKYGLHVLSSQQLPVNDGGLSLGQAWIAATGNIPKL